MSWKEPGYLKVMEPPYTTLELLTFTLQRNKLLSCLSYCILHFLPHVSNANLNKNIIINEGR